MVGKRRPNCPIRRRSRARERGIDIKVVSEILGHTQTWFTRDTYQHVTKTLHDDAAEQMSGALWG